MRRLSRWMGQQVKRWVALIVILALFSLSRLPAVSATEREAIASRFHFTSSALPAIPTQSSQLWRPVHPSLERHSGWISAVGAAVALNDLDGDGLANDVCYVETRSDQVIVAPVPGTNPRYQPFTLVANSHLYNPKTMAPMGCLPGDVNEDGQMDILVYYWGRTPVAFLKQSTKTGNLQASDYIPQALLPGDEQWYTNAATLSDIDGDGHNDLIVGNFFPDNAQILNTQGTGQEFMQHSLNRADNGGGHHLLRWLSATATTVNFQEIPDVWNESKAQPWALAVGTADLDGDMLPEIYFANDFGPDRLLHNRSQPGKFQFGILSGKKTLTTPNSKVLGHDSFKGMGVDFGDVNGDGWLDIYVSNIASEYALEESHFLFISTGEVKKMTQGIAPYVDRSEPLGVSRGGWGWDTKFGDFDNDGSLEALQATGFMKGTVNRWPELHELAMGNDEMLSITQSWPRLQSQAGDDLSGHDHNPFFIRAKDGRYYDFAKELGLDKPYVTRGIATADVDGDGDLDFAIANQFEESYFYRNDSPHSGKFLGLHLLLPPVDQTIATTQVKAGHPQPGVVGSPAIGASATIHLPNGRELVAQVDGGNGHSGARSPELHFGLGKVADNTQLAVDIRWRDRQGQVHQESLLLSPGWQTVLLGDSTKTALRFR
jgi:hypothetical protein